MNFKKIDFKGFYLNLKVGFFTQIKIQKNKFVNSWQTQQNTINLPFRGIEGAV